MRRWKVLGVAGLVAAAAATVAAAASRRNGPTQPGGDRAAGADRGRRRPSRGARNPAAVAGAGTPSSNGDRRPRHERR